MKTMKNYLILGLMAFALVLGSCSKDGEIGSIGPQGLPGVQGVQGEQGPKGGDGENGNANIIYSEWFTSGGNWTQPGLSGYDAYFDRAAPGVTQEIIDSGIVLAFGDFSRTSVELRPLPATSGNGVTSLWNFLVTEVGNIRFTFTDLEHDGNNNPSRFIEFRYVIVPGGQLGAKGTTKNELKKMTYEEVMDYFGLEY